MDIRDFITGKVRFDGYSDGAIFDEDNNHIADARSWGRISKLENADKKHDFLTNFIVDAINEKLQRIVNPSPLSNEDFEQVEIILNQEETNAELAHRQEYIELLYNYYQTSQAARNTTKG